MLYYIVRRLLLMIPTLLGIMIINFVIIHFAPGGPVEQMISQIKRGNLSVTERITGDTSDLGNQNSKLQSADFKSDINQKYRGAQGLDPDLIKRIEKIYGFDKPPVERFFNMMGRYLTFNFDKGLFSDKSVIDLILEKLPVSVSLGLWTTILVYLVSIPLGIRKAVKLGTPFDGWSSTIIIVLHAIPGFLLGIFLLVVFAGGSFVKWFPLQGLTSENFSRMPWYQQILDYLWHMVLPIVAMTLGGFASLTFLTKNSFLEEIRKQYVVTARAKGLAEKKILYGHVFRNAMLIVIAGFPAAFLSILFTGSLLIEVTFSIEGIGYLGYIATIKRDYPIMFGSLYFFSLLGLLMRLVNDLMYAIIDPRIDFETREV
ncbi:MAG: microcin C ABC transporter permease YejB [Spirochaetales bacterium]|nr:microcin C ABC transporter permease YejB [Spirochaetales bacterium]